MPGQQRKAGRSSPPSGRPARGYKRRFLRLAAPYWGSEERWKARGLLAGLALLTVGQVAILVALNFWNAAFFDALERRSAGRLALQAGQLALILLASLAVAALHLRAKRAVQLGWRRWLTRRLLEDWMAAGGPGRLAAPPGTHDNPDGRIAEDVRQATEAAVDLAHSLLYTALLLAGFVRILWPLSGTLHLALGNGNLAIPGHMIWAALIYAGLGSALAFVLARPLVQATDARQTMEADFRFGLVGAREDAAAGVRRRGEGLRRLLELFGGIERAWARQTTTLARIAVFASGYGMAALAVPLLIAAPRYVAGAITLGGLVQTAQAFQQVASALAWPVDNLARVAEWRASVERVLALHDALHGPDRAREEAGLRPRSPAP